MDLLNNLEFDWNHIDLYNKYNFVPSVPKDFLWGFTTSALHNEGRSYNNSFFANIQKGSCGTGGFDLNCPPGMATNHYDLIDFEADILLAKKFHTNSYRMTIDWSRVIPEPDYVDQDAINHYREMLQIVLKHELTPIVGLQHLMVPTWFFNKGDFMEDENVEYFKEWCEIFGESFGDLVKTIDTLVEPNIYADKSYKNGWWPAVEVSQEAFDQYNKNILRSHVKCYHALKKSKYGKSLTVGISLSHNYQDYFKYNLKTKEEEKIVFNDYYYRSMDLRGNYYKFFLEDVYSAGDQYFYQENAIDTLDYFGIIYYTRDYWIYDTKKDSFANYYSDQLMTSYWYPVYAEGLYRSLVEAHQLNKPMIISETGSPDDEWRTVWMKRHFYSIKKYMDDYKEDSLLKGFHWWTLVSNWEMNYCYSKHFGMYQMVGKDKQRKINPGAKKYAEYIDYSYMDKDKGKEEGKGKEMLNVNQSLDYKVKKENRMKRKRYQKYNVEDFDDNQDEYEYFYDGVSRRKTLRYLTGNHHFKK